MKTEAQIFPTTNAWFNSTCNMQTLHDRVNNVDSSCQPGVCALDCITALLPLIDECSTMLNLIMDGSDGTYDGVYQPMADIMTTCNNLPTSGLVDDLRMMHEQGHCPNAVLDGVAVAELKAPRCEDVWGARCGAVVSTGVMSCEVDFCSTVPSTQAPCDLAGLCDSTCGFCEASEDGEGHHRRRLLALVHDVRRELQMSFGMCDPSTFSDQAALVDTACCDDDGSSCTEGTPTECDAKCAIVYNDFYRRCQSFLGAMSPTLTDAYERLFTSCSRALPTLPLLRAVAMCGSDPCTGVSCGINGTCFGEQGGIAQCQCDSLHSGDRCEVLHCPALPQIGEATIVVSNDGRAGASTATYACDSGDAPTGGDATRPCQADGSWGGTAPTQCGGGSSQDGECCSSASLFLPCISATHEIR